MRRPPHMSKSQFLEIMRVGICTRREGGRGEKELMEGGRLLERWGGQQGKAGRCCKWSCPHARA